MRTDTETRTPSVLDTLLMIATETFPQTKTLGRALAPEDDMFSVLGIDSMQALSLLTALEEKFGVGIPDYEVQDVRTFAELAEVVALRVK